MKCILPEENFPFQSKPCAQIALTVEYESRSLKDKIAAINRSRIPEHLKKELNLDALELGEEYRANIVRYELVQCGSESIFRLPEGTPREREYTTSRGTFTRIRPGTNDYYFKDLAEGSLVFEENSVVGQNSW